MIVEGKNAIRRKLLRLRRAMDEEERLKLSRKIKENLFDLPEYGSAEVIMFYMAHDKEVETREMIADSLCSKRVLLPKVDIEGGKIVPVEIENLDDVGKGAFGIEEPRGREEYSGKIDMVVVPGIAFDLRGYRVGYGKGFYDGFLRDVSSLKVGLAFDFQVVDHIMEDANDVPMDIVVTEKRIIRC